jgi:hypothetical protein
MLLGELVAGQKEGADARKMMMSKIDGLTASVNTLVASVKAVDDGHSALKEHVDKNVMPVISEMGNIKNRGIGLLLGVGLVAGGAGSIMTWLGKAFAAMFGGIK